MSVLLCTSNYRATLGLPEKLVVPDGEDNALLGPWYANTLFIGSHRYLHYMSSQTLLPIIVWLRERSTAETRMMSSLKELLLQIGAPTAAVEAEVEALTSLFYGRASDRSRLASMRDQKVTAKHLVQGGRSTSPSDLTMDLAQMPSGALAYRMPLEKTAEVLKAGAAWRRLIWCEADADAQAAMLRERRCTPPGPTGVTMAGEETHCQTSVSATSRKPIRMASVCCSASI